jgi:hypothetical protein
MSSKSTKLSSLARELPINIYELFTNEAVLFLESQDGGKL